ncbi:beta-secretase 2-like isoform X2 [Acropora palmata]|uniref:beta-secretase 2-like isoform X2 n=1 Tax=Acropora palmata TaxID=6131 RepID=UPI003DA130B8
MLARWLLSDTFLLLTLLRVTRPFAFERKMSTASFDLRRKTKHHRHRNGTTLLPTTKPVTMNDEEMEFSLRSTSYAYVIELDLGTPPQRMEFLVDTGSSNMAVAGRNCRDEMERKCAIDTFYYPEKSNTSEDQHIPIETEYGKGAWSGNIYRDVVAFPGDGNSINEGILGLAYKSLATDDVQPLYDQLVQDNKVPNVFSLGLCNGMGKIWLDLPEPFEYHRPIRYTNINQETWYSVSMTGIDIAGHNLGLLLPHYSSAIVDSGTTDILLQPEVYSAVITELKLRGPPVDERFWKSYCVDTDPYQWPYITIYLKDTIGGSFGLTVLGKHYVRKQDEFYCLSIGAKRSGAVLGEVVMEGNVVVFDRANQRIGFAPSNISQAEAGPCGNPIRVNNTVKGRLHKYCRAPDMPQETCFMGCKSCIKYGGVWCPKGHVVVWINGVRSVLSTTKGFCWPGGLFTLDDAKVQTFLNGHGSAEFQAYCDTLVPMYRQCSVAGIWILFLSGLAFFCLCTLFLYVSCRGVTKTKSESDGLTPNSTEQIKDEHVCRK